MLKHTAAFFFLVFLAGCSTVGNYQSSCEKQYNYFPQVVECLKQKLNTDPRFENGPDSDLAKLYVAYADKLSDEVQKKKISEVDAKLALAQFYTNLKNQSLHRRGLPAS